MATGSFITELTRAANETSKLTPHETTRLLQQAAAKIRSYREQLNYPEMPANDRSQGDIVFDLMAMASAVELFSPERISAMLEEAASTIRVCKILAEGGNIPENGL